MDIKRPEPKLLIPNDAECVYDGKIFQIFRWNQIMYDGSTAVFESARRKADSVNVIPITKEGRIIVTKQEQPQQGTFIGAIGGRTEPEESPLETAKRELKEESGIIATEYRLLFAQQPIVKTDWASYTFIAKNLEYTEIELNGGEKIELIELTFEEFLDALAIPNYRDSELALYILSSLRDKNRFEEIKKIFFD